MIEPEDLTEDGMEFEEWVGVADEMLQMLQDKDCTFGDCMNIVSLVASKIYITVSGGNPGQIDECSEFTKRMTYTLLGAEQK